MFLRLCSRDVFYVFGGHNSLASRAMDGEL